MSSRSCCRRARVMGRPGILKMKTTMFFVDAKLFGWTKNQKEKKTKKNSKIKKGKNFLFCYFVIGALLTTNGYWHCIEMCIMWRIVCSYGIGLFKLWTKYYLLRISLDVLVRTGNNVGGVFFYRSICTIRHRLNMWCAKCASIGVHRPIFGLKRSELNLSRGKTYSNRQFEPEISKRKRKIGRSSAKELFNSHSCTSTGQSRTYHKCTIRLMHANIYCWFASQKRINQLKIYSSSKIKQQFIFPTRFANTIIMIMFALWQMFNSHRQFNSNNHPDRDTNCYNLLPKIFAQKPKANVKQKHQENPNKRKEKKIN